MLKLFDPQTKVQKDRQIVRDTDMRMAKYSRRGLISNFLIYALCLAMEGAFVKEHHSLAIILTSGLLLITLIRGYFLFRMDAIYPRGPAAWRTKYFLATLAGATWWGVILGSITLFMDMKGEASLMWLYTVVFFSTTAHAFAPYKRFLSVYQFLGLVPASLCTFFIGEYIGPFYGFILLSFYVILNYHCSLMSLNYWERLEAQYTLAKKSVSLEEEKRDTRASVQLSNDYVSLLSKKIEAMLEGSEPHDSELATLSKNVSEFKKVVSKEVEAEQSIFNIRHLLQNIAQPVVNTAEQKGFNFETSLSPALPSRMIGDANLLSRIISIMIHHAVECGKEHTLFMDAEFVREFESSGELLVTISRPSKDTKRSLFQSEDDLIMPLTLDLVLAKGLAEALNGGLEVDESGVANGKYLQFRCPLKVAEIGDRPEYHRLAYKGRPLLLIHSNNHWLKVRSLELETMGFDVKTAYDLKSALQALEQALMSGKAIQSVVYSISPSSDLSVEFCNEILEHNELKYIHQFVVCSNPGRAFFSQRIIVKSPLIHYIDKPAGFFEFEASFSAVFEQANVNYLNVVDDEKASVAPKSTNILWISLSKDFDCTALYESDTTCIHNVTDIKQASKLFVEHTIKVVIIQYSDARSIQYIQKIRAEEKRLGFDSFVPIVGIGPIEQKSAMLIGGVDHFVDFKTLTRGEVPALRFWVKGGHH